MVEMISATEAKKFLDDGEKVNLNRFIENFNEEVSNACKVGKNFIKIPAYLITQKKRDIIKECGYKITVDIQTDESIISW